MIDDNWFSVAKDYPDQGEIFVAGNENYDNFLEALNLCKTTWLFNDLLREDAIAYTRNVQKFTIAIDPRMFECKSPRNRTDNEILIGFSGSLRWSDCAFRALARVARRYKNVRLVLIGDLSPNQENLFKGLSPIRLPKTSYVEYARNIARIGPDLLIAPLEKTHTDQSKCFNKFLENSIVGAAGIYSRTKPYIDVVIDGYNGFFVDNETDENWYIKLTEVLSDIPHLREVQRQAKKDVLERFTIKKLSGLFADKLVHVIEDEVLTDD
jgi:glycosyltransferase involved in cell wall biosynthesis